MTSANNPTSLEEAVVQSVGLTDLRDAVTGVAEVGLDQLLLEGPARDVPVLGTLLRLAATIGAVRDHLFARKVAKFLFRVGEASDEERAAFTENLSNPEERKRLGEALILLLDRLDDMRKPDLLGLLFQAYLKGQVDFTTFQRLYTALDRINVALLPSLRLFYNRERREPGAAVRAEQMIPGDVLQEFAAAGLARISFPGVAVISPTGDRGGGFGCNELGALFVKITTPAPQNTV